MNPSIEEMMIFPMDPLEEDTKTLPEVAIKIGPPPVYLVPAPAQLRPETNNNLRCMATSNQFNFFWRNTNQIQAQIQEVASTSPSGTTPETPPDIHPGYIYRDIPQGGIFMMEF